MRLLCCVQAVCGRIVVGQVREKVVQWTESNVTASYFSKELQAEVDRLARLQGRGLLFLIVTPGAGPGR